MHFDLLIPNLFLNYLAFQSFGFERFYCAVMDNYYERGDGWLYGANQYNT
jgi:hypothetical protein